MLAKSSPGVSQPPFENLGFAWNLGVGSFDTNSEKQDEIGGHNDKQAFHPTSDLFPQTKLVE
jgi:hypothetical protein